MSFDPNNRRRQDAGAGAGSSSGRSLTTREAEVLERQRRMAEHRRPGSMHNPHVVGSPNGPRKPSVSTKALPSSAAGGPGGVVRSLASLTGGGGASSGESRPRRQEPPRALPSDENGCAHKRPPLKRPRPPGPRPPPPPPSSKQRTQPPHPPSRPETAQAALARARKRVIKPGGSGGGGNEKGVAAMNANKLKRAPIRKNRTAVAAAAAASSSGGRSAAGGLGGGGDSGGRGGGGGAIASLLSNGDAAKYLRHDAPKLLKHYPKVEPDDYWRNMRSWDLIGEMNERMGAQRRGGRGSGGAENEPKKNRPPLPETFQSYRQYCALWSPLCLEEARAQLLSEAVQEIPYWKSKSEKGPIRVMAQPLKRDLGGDSDHISVLIKRISSSPPSCASGTRRSDNEVYGGNGGGGGGGRGPSFMSNDLVLLAREESVIWHATKGTLSSGGGGDCGLVGHVEFGRKTVDGLVLQLSRALWPKLVEGVRRVKGNGGSSSKALTSGGAPQMELVLLKIGANITSLREFTALCRVDTIPLLECILDGGGSGKKRQGGADDDGEGEKEGVGENADADDGADSEQQERRKKKEMLAGMGGAAALGKGFFDYARKKFNPSQLGAVAASAREYGDGGFTLIKGPPGTGKTTTLCALLNALHIRQMNQYFGEVKSLAVSYDAVVGKRAAISLSNAAKKRPRILVCAPSNAAVDNVILKIMETGFVGGDGTRYNPSIVRVGKNKSASVKDVCLEDKVDSYMSDAADFASLENTIEGYKAECRRIHADIAKLRTRMNAIKAAAPWPLVKDWEIRLEEDTFDSKGRVFFVNHKTKTTTFEVPPPPEPGERHFPSHAMPEYKAFVNRVVKLVERYNNISTNIERYGLCQSVATALKGGKNNHAMISIRQQLETHILDSAHIVMTTLGTAGNRALEAANKFEVVVIDEAAQSVEPSTLAGLQLGSSHAILVGDPQQLPATIFSVSGRNTKYDRSLFQRLEEAGHEVHMLNTQYRMHPKISDFPRRIFYDGDLFDGVNVRHPEYGKSLKRAVFTKFPSFQPFTVLDLESSEERGGTSLANTAEAHLALHLFNNMEKKTNGISVQSKVAIITPYAQQAALLRRTFSSSLGSNYERFVEVNTVDAFQGREANIVIFSCVRAAGSRGIGFLSDVRRMNVALTRAKHFLFVIARCSSIVVNPYWRDLVEHARETKAVIRVPVSGSRQESFSFPDLASLEAMAPPPKPIIPINMKTQKLEGQDEDNGGSTEDGEVML